MASKSEQMIQDYIKEQKNTLFKKINKIYKSEEIAKMKTTKVDHCMTNEAVLELLEDFKFVMIDSPVEKYESCARVKSVLGLSTEELLSMSQIVITTTKETCELYERVGKWCLERAKNPAWVAKENFQQDIIDMCNSLKTE